MTAAMPAVLSTCWSMFSSGLQAHQLGLVEGQADDVSALVLFEQDEGLWRMEMHS